MISDVYNFIKLEEEKKLFNDNINGFYYWGYLRYIIFTMLLQNKNITEASISTMPMQKKIFTFIYNFFCSFLHFPFLYFGKTKKILFIQSTQKNLINGKFMCRFTDLIIDKNKNESYIYTDSYVSNKNKYHKTLHSLSFIDYFSRIFTILPINNKLNNKLKLKSDYICDLINDNFDTKLQKSIIYKLFKNYYQQEKIINILFNLLLKKLKPKVIVFECHNNLSKMVMLKVAKNLSIDTIELQHGIISSSHIAYNYFTSCEHDFLPTKMLFWSDYWKNNCNFPIKNINKISTGFPFYDFETKKYTKSTNSSDNNYNIVIFSQPNITKKFIGIFSNLIEIFANKKIKYHIIYKLHPGEFNINKSIFTKLYDNPNITFVSNLNTDLYYCFSKSNIQIGANSTTLFEGIGYGLKTYIFNSGLDKDDMESLITNFDAELFSNSHELFNKIINPKNINTKKDSYFYFKQNALENIQNVLNQYLN